MLAGILAANMSTLDAGSVTNSALFIRRASHAECPGRYQHKGHIQGIGNGFFQCRNITGKQRDQDNGKTQYPELSRIVEYSLHGRVLPLRLKPASMAFSAPSERDVASDGDEAPKSPVLCREGNRDTIIPLSMGR